MIHHLQNDRYRNHVELCDRHVETRGPKGIRIHWGVPTFHGAASPTSRRGIPGGGFLVSGVPGWVKSRLGSPPSWGSRGRTSERSGPGVLRCLQSAGRPQGRDPIQPLSATWGIHFQSLSAICGSTLSHMWFHMPATCGSTYPWTPWHSTSNGVAKGMVEGAGSGMAGVRDDIQQRVERRTPSVAGQMRFHGAEAVGGLGALPDGRAPGGRGQGVRWGHGVSIRNGHP
jgi:hypothetical protein